MKRFLGRLLSKDGRYGEKQQITVGVAAMDKKAKSKQMNEILERLRAYNEFEIIIFGEDVILNKPIEEWPVVETLLSWHSDGFPLEKAQAYASLRRPFTVNDLFAQHLLQDRIGVYRTLVANAIPVPQHIIVEREGLEPGKDPPGFVETEDYVELNGVRITKPFVEKPGSAEDHNVHIYYPSSMGGGVKKLFRKVANTSSSYDHSHPGTIRRDGSYIYEEFLPTGGTDVKVYTVGPRYAHAEARKSPVVDGKVLRTADGKEMRFPVLLTPQEKEIARQVVVAFGQNVCGFDLLRSEKGKSYVCDVNGWSFVKNSRRFYDDTAGILRNILLGAVAPARLAANPNPAVSFKSAHSITTHSRSDPSVRPDDRSRPLDFPVEDEDDEGNLPDIDPEEQARTDNRTADEELRCVLAVIRHGDRTPKQKLKIKVTADPLLNLFHKHKDAKGKQAKLKTPGQLQELLDITRELLASLTSQTSGGAGVAEGDGSAPAPLTEEQRDAALELREKLRIVQTVLEQASFNGINRKVQLKPTRWVTAPTPPATTTSPDPNPPSVATEGARAAEGSDAAGASAEVAAQQQQQPVVSRPSGGSGGGTSGGPAPPSTKPIVHSATAGSLSSAPSLAGALGSAPGQAPGQGGVQQQVLEEALMVVKWGGVLTHAGRQQAEDLGRVFRICMYPSNGSAGGGLLRLHSTYRHDLKIYSSDEGRVQASAAAFAKGLLDLEGTSLTPILVSLVKKDASMLDAFGKGASDDIRIAKAVLYEAMTSDPDRAGPGSSGGGPSLVPPRSARPSAPPSPQSGRAAGGGKPPGSTGGDATVGAAAPAPDISAASSTQQLEDGGTTAAAAGALPAGVPDPLAPPRPSVTFGADMRTSFTRINAALSQSATSRSHLRGLPENPVSLLRRLVELMKVLVGQLRELCVQEGAARTANPPPNPVSAGPTGGTTGGVGRYSSVTHAPAEWRLDKGQPCGGEKLLLMFDRWQKLHKSFYSEKKGTFDISKVPDIYDSAKYDAIHNSHLVDCKELYHVSKQLADVVIPSEYGVDPGGKLRIGSKIATELLGKLLVDLAAMREESLTTQDEEVAACKLKTPGSAGARPLSKAAAAAGGAHVTGPSALTRVEYMSRMSGAAGDKAPTAASCTTDMAAAGQVAAPLIGRPSIVGSIPEAPGEAEGQEGTPRSNASVGSNLGGLATATSEGGAAAGGGGKEGGKEDGEGDEDRDSDDEGGGDKESDEEVEAEETIHRLLPEYAPHHINSPLRHVRTRIYFTSESHIHSLVNVLRYCHMYQSSLSNSMVLTKELSMRESMPGTGGPSDGGYIPLPPALQETSSCSPLLSPSACDLLDNTRELDYLTHIVLRMYESKTAPVDSPERFRVELLFSPGANVDPFKEKEKGAAATRARSTHSRSGGSEGAVEQQGTGAGGAEASGGGALKTQALPQQADEEEGEGDCLGKQASSVSEIAAEAAAAIQGGSVKGRPHKGCRGPDWHVLPVVPRVALHDGPHGIPLTHLEDILLPMAKVNKFAPPSYAAQLLARQNPGLQGGNPGASRISSRFGSVVGGMDSRRFQHGTGTDTPASTD